MRIQSVTDIGIKRKDNQDNYWSARLDIDGVEAGVLCLCDGMGGLSKGGFASSTVVAKVKDFFSRSLDFGKLQVELKAVNSELSRMSKEEKSPMGTTCTIVFCMSGTYKVLHIGDSRCYKISNGIGEVLTKDHTVIEKYKAEGRELPDRLINKYRNMLTRCIGVIDNIYFDYSEGNYESGDMFLVCSDGFWHYLSEDCLTKDILLSKENIQSVIDNFKFVDRETDNITVGVLEV